MKRRNVLCSVGALACAALLPARFAAAQTGWSSYGGDAQHTALSPVAAQSLDRIYWQTPVDLNPQFSGNDLLIHYGTPVISNNNTVIVPVKTGATDGFKVEALNGATGALIWQQTTDYVLPSHNWTPSYSPVLTPSGRLYFAGAGGTLFFRDNVDSAVGAINQVGTFNANTRICSPLTSDAQGNIYFGYRVEGTNTGGIGKITPGGTATYIPMSTLTGGVAIQTAMNVAPAVSNDGQSIYVVGKNGGGAGTLVKLNAATLTLQTQVALKDPKSGNNAIIPDDGTASPTVGSDGKVYFGVLDSPLVTDKGWMLQFDANLVSAGAPGAFGWDDSASLVPASMVPSYAGSSPYLLMTKYNDYAGLGGSGVNKIAILDPNATQIDARTGATVMKEILTIAGVTPDEDFPGVPGAVREWCINTAVVDPLTGSVYANNEDGKLYRWDLSSNTFSQVITLTSGIGEAYTPTLIGTDGKVYAINNATLFAIGATAPEPGSLAFLALAGSGLLLRGVVRRRRK